MRHGAFGARWFAVVCLFDVTAGAGLRDNSIVADSIVYLDGTWTATATEPTCDFLQDIDFDDSSLAGKLPGIATSVECCQLCWATSNCAAAVHYQGSCWLKGQQQLSKRINATGRIACVKKAVSNGLSIPATVPGDLISDLYAAGVIGNPLYEDNFLNSSIWDKNEWTYHTTFAGAAPGSLLVFDGVKMGAHIKVNGVALGQTTDQFLRYTFELSESVLRSGDNVLEVTFDKTIHCDGRWMACTGGWDWAPYTNTKQEGAQTFTKGIWKSVYIASFAVAAIEHFVPHVFYMGAYPVEPLTDGSHGDFEVRARVHFIAKGRTSGVLRVSGAWGMSAAQRIDVPAGSSSVTLTVRAPADQLKLWWPAGLGDQHLYDITAEFARDDGSAMISAKRQIGFRFVVLVTGNDTDPVYVQRAAAQEGSDSQGMMLRVNGAAIWSRGANMIPMEEMEGWLDADAHDVLVRSARQGRMNTLRVWGGGMFLPDAFYDACDRYGLLVYHDMQYAQSGHDPKATPTQDAELRHAIRRLSHHASIVIWDGCNECQVVMGTETSIYATFVMTVVAEEDASRVVWPSCPALGWTTGVHKLTQLPNGNKLTTPDKGRSIEEHGPYQHGTGFPAVNGATKLQLLSPNIPLTLQKNQTGPQFENVFASEFGAVVMSSFESMSPTLDPKHWALHAGQPSDTCTSEFANTCNGSNVMAQRNYPCDNIIYTYFGKTGQDLNKTGEISFKKQLYQCMIGQALQVKQDLETRRSKNQLGTFIWQYNEIWPTGGWGSIEYGNPNFPGQVLGGRWKPLQYWYKASIFADVMASCGSAGVCYVKNDAPKRFSGALTLQATCFETGEVATVLTKPLELDHGVGVSKWFVDEQVAALDGTTHILEAIVADSSGAVVSQNVIPFATPENMKLKPAGVSVSVAQDGDDSFVAVVSTQAVAMYVTLTTLAHGVFEDNAFLLRPPGRRVKFLPSQPSPESLHDAFRTFASSLRVEDVSTYRDTASVEMTFV